MPTEPWKCTRNVRGGRHIYYSGCPAGANEQEQRNPWSTRTGDGEHLNEAKGLIESQQIVQALKKTASSNVKNRRGFGRMVLSIEPG